MARETVSTMPGVLRRKCVHLITFIAFSFNVNVKAMSYSGPLCHKLSKGFIVNIMTDLRTCLVKILQDFVEGLGTGGTRRHMCSHEKERVAS